jgi:hypothetical protein
MEIVPKSNYEKSERNQMDLLLSNIKNCKNFKISVAYFTDIFGPKRKEEKNIFVEKLKNGSFVCVSPDLPTQFTFLEELNENNADIYICGPFVDPKKKNEFISLMHTKIYVFEMMDFVEIWIGSMNFTNQGITGKNLECNVKFQCSYDDERYFQILEYLEYIKTKKSSSIGNVNLNILKKVMESKNPKLGELHGGSYKDIIFLLTLNFDSLKITEEKYLQLLINSDRYKKYLNQNEKVIIAFIDNKKKTKNLFEFRVTQIGVIEEGKTNVSFENDKPFGLIVQSIKNPVFDKSKFLKIKSFRFSSFITLKLIRKVSDEIYYADLDIELFTRKRIVTKDEPEYFLQSSKYPEKEDAILFLNPEIYSYRPVKFDFEEVYNTNDLEKKTKTIIDYIENNQLEINGDDLNEYFKTNSDVKLKNKHLLIPLDKYITK